MHRKSVDGAPTFLASSVESALRRIKAQDKLKPIHCIFLIGGASLYTECLNLPAGTEGFVDRILLTRVTEPSFEDCDTFLQDFTKDENWQRASHNELVGWVGTPVSEGEQEEKGVKYEFQMWTRAPKVRS